MTRKNFHTENAYCRGCGYKFRFKMRKTDNPDAIVTRYREEIDRHINADWEPCRNPILAVEEIESECRAIVTRRLNR